MTALTKERATNERAGDTRCEALAASMAVLKGAIVMRNASGYLTKGATATGSFGVGRTEESVNNTGAAGAAVLTYKRGTFSFTNFASDLVTLADVGKLCYIVDDQTVAKTNGTGTRSVAGIVDGIEGGSVWLRFDEAVARAS